SLVEMVRDLLTKGAKREATVGSRSLTVDGDRSQKIDGTQSLTVEGDQQEKVGQDHALDVGGEIYLGAGEQLVHEAPDITFKAGGNFVRVHGGGVTIHGDGVDINVGGSPGQGKGSAPKAYQKANEAFVAEPGPPNDVE